MESSALGVRHPAARPWMGVAGVLAFAVIFAATLWWSKWSPYAHKLSDLFASPHWTGTNMLNDAGAAGSAPSLAGAWSFTRAYFTDIWPGFLTALLIASAASALVPREWLLRLLRHRGPQRSALAGGLSALPTLMCTCCAAPLAVTLRRDGAPPSAALAYWIGNPVLNPLVLAFLAVVAPWQWVLTRIVVGALLVFGATAWVGRLAPADAAVPLPTPAATPPRAPLPSAPERYLRTFVRLTVTLVPLYVAAVFAIGLLRGWLLPIDAAAVHWAVPSVLAAAALGILVVIPTAGEIPILLALSAAGVSGATIGVLLITLPAISLASMVMVARTFSIKLTAAMAGAVALCGLLGGGVLLALGG